jgi:hypothetical protein
VVSGQIAPEKASFRLDFGSVSGQWESTKTRCDEQQKGCLKEVE